MIYLTSLRGSRVRHWSSPPQAFHAYGVGFYASTALGYSFLFAASTIAELTVSSATTVRVPSPARGHQLAAQINLSQVPYHR
jgi:hypothetical protein